MDIAEHPFLEIIEQHQALLDRICRSFCGENREDREDLRQDILLNLWRGWKHWKPNHKPITWIYRVAMNTAISWRRNRSRRIETTQLTDLDIPQEEENKDETEQLYEMLRRLPSSDQRIIQLYIDGWNSKEIATMMQITESNATTRIYRIKEKLREQYNKEHNETR